MTAVLRDHPAPVAIHLERDHGIRKALAIVVEEQERVHERVTERMMQRTIRVREVESFLEESGRQHLRRRSMALVGEHRLLRLLPDVVPPRVGPRPMLDGLVGQHAEGRDDVLLEVLVLIVAPDHDEVGGEIVELPSRFAEPPDELFTMSARGTEPLVLASFAPHGFRPPVGHTVFGGKIGILEDAPQDTRHVLIASGQEWNVRHTESENRSHGGSSSSAASLAAQWYSRTHSTERRSADERVRASASRLERWSSRSPP